jgi:hypothetical protein
MAPSFMTSVIDRGYPSVITTFDAVLSGHSKVTSNKASENNKKIFI